MKKCFLLCIIYFLHQGDLFSQNNCSNSLSVTICPSVYLANQTNAGMGDDAPVPYNSVGEDLVYQINIINGASTIYVSIINSNATLKLTMLPGSCSTGSTYSRLSYAGSRNFNFYVGNQATCYLWIDATTNATFDISIGADTGLTYINIPNTRGNLRFDSSSCALPVFNAAKPFFRVSYNGVFQTNPMTLSPLNVTGTMCIDAYFKNTTGIEGIKRFDVFFNGGYTSVIAADTLPGFYNAGNWISRTTGNDWTFDFFDSAGISKGDFTGTPNTCLTYHFCFDIIPNSNNPVATNVAMNVYTDGFGAGYSGYIHSGCCASLYPNCFGSYGGPGSSNSFGFAFDDPGSPLPIELIEFSGETNDDQINLKWTTSSEINNDYFTIEKSSDEENWKDIGQLNGFGNSTIEREFRWIDENPISGNNFYRLKQVDFDGAFSYSKIISVNYKNENSFIVYPNPVDEQLIIEIENKYSNSYTVVNLLGEKIIETFNTSLSKVQINTSNITAGIYYLIVNTENGKTEKRKIVIHHK
jgi:hypothetical protein